jgi:hypothetical protein
VGYFYIPFIIKILKTDINGETVWFANKWKNLLLKLKRIFIKPKHLKYVNLYKNKTPNPSYYGKIKINDEDLCKIK